MGHKRLFFDIETSYNIGWFWQPSYQTSINYEQIIKPSAIICICYKWQGSDKVYNLTWDKGNDKEMVKKFFDIINEADEVVSHNGDKFDIKWIRTRFLVYGYKSMPEIKSIDTLKISRSKFKFHSNRLDAIGKFLGFGGKKQHSGIQLWHDIIQKNSKKAMKEMLEYCKRDVELLEKVFLKLEGYAKPKTNIAVSEGNKGNSCDCPYCASDKYHITQTRVSATGTIKRTLQCNECKKFYTVTGAVYDKYNKIVKK